MKTATTNPQANQRLEVWEESQDWSAAVKSLKTAKSSASTNEAVVGRGKRRCSAVLQAGNAREFHMPPPAMLRCLEEWFVEKNGGPARNYEDTTLEQLSALAARLVPDEGPHADFTVFRCWGPGGAEVLASVQDGDVEAQCIAARHAGRHVSVVEDQLRSERWETPRSRVESMVQKSQFQGIGGPNRPWAAVIAHSARGAGRATCLGGSRTWTSRACNRPPPALALHCSRSWKEDRREPCRAMGLAGHRAQEAGALVRGGPSTRETSVLSPVRRRPDASHRAGRRMRGRTPDHREQVAELRQRFRASRAEVAAAQPKELDRTPRVLVHTRRVPELTTPREVRMGEDARCTVGLRNPARLLDRWPSLRTGLRPIRAAFLTARACRLVCVGLTWRESRASSTLGRERGHRQRLA